MDNPGYTQDREAPVDHMRMQEVNDTKISNMEPQTILVNSNDVEPMGRDYRLSVDDAKATKVAPLDGRDEDQDEDYSLLSYWPGYEEFKRKYKERMESGNTSMWVSAGIFAGLAAVYAAYFLSVISIVSRIEQHDYWCSGDGLLLIMTSLALVMMLYFLVLKKYFGKQIYKEVMKPFMEQFDEYFEKKVVRYGIYAALVAALVIFLVVDTWNNPQRLVSLIGLFLLLLFGFVFSAAPRKVVWRHVAWGVSLQFILGILILRWPVGRAVFSCAGDKVSTFLAFTDKGSAFVFGDLVANEKNFFFAFKVLPVILFFSFCVQILYYIGVLQWVVIKLGWLLQVTVGTTACESVNAAANIFLGQTEAPLVIKPYLSLMTKSELHAVLTGGFATIAGSVMAAYISFGVSASHLLSASVMSAPAALAYAKLFYPETEKTKTNAKDIPIVKGTEVNALHAAIEGVVAAIPLVAGIAANLIAFIAFIAFFNAVFNWSCMLVNIDDGVCTLETVFGYIFMPLAWSMGVVWTDCYHVGTLIGIKTIVNEFVAYSTLSEMVKAGQLTARSEIIATYALCGFSNISSIGIQMGGLGSLAPERRPDIARVVVRAMIAGSAACFMTGCIAGTLLDDDSLGRSSRNITEITELI